MFNLNIMPKFNFKPIEFRLPMAKVFDTLEKFFGSHSKQPFTVKVSKPNSFLNINDKDSLCIEISYWVLSIFLSPEKIEYS